MKTSIINNVKIDKVLDHQSTDKNRIIGYNLFPSPYCCVNILASANSGKSSTIYRILENVCYKSKKNPANIYIFCPTIHSDPIYKKMIKMLEDEKHATVYTYQDLYDDGGRNILESIMHDLEKEQPVEALEEHVKEPVQKYDPIFCSIYNVAQPTPAKKPKKPKEHVPTKDYAHNIFILDDLSTSLRDKSVSRLCSKYKHFKSKVFLSSHFLTNLQPMSIKQLNYILIYKGMSYDRIKQIADTLGLMSPDDTKGSCFLWKIYQYACSEKYNFLYIDIRNNEFRKNFNEKIELE